MKQESLLDSNPWPLSSGPFFYVLEQIMMKSVKDNLDFVGGHYKLWSMIGRHLCQGHMSLSGQSLYVLSKNVWKGYFVHCLGRHLCMLMFCDKLRHQSITACSKYPVTVKKQVFDYTGCFDHTAVEKCAYLYCGGKDGFIWR